MNRRGFFSKLFGGAAAAAVAPHLPAKALLASKLKPGRRIFYATKSLGYGAPFATYHPKHAIATRFNLEAVQGEFDVYPGIEQIPDCEVDFPALENNRVSIEKYLAQDGLGVTSFGRPPGCPLGYY